MPADIAILVDWRVRGTRDTLLAGAEHGGRSLLELLLDWAREALPESPMAVLLDQGRQHRDLDFKRLAARVQVHRALETQPKDWSSAAALGREIFAGRNGHLLLLRPFCGPLSPRRLGEFLSGPDLANDRELVHLSLRVLHHNKHPAWLLAVTPEGRTRSPSRDLVRHMDQALGEAWPKPGKCCGSQFLPSLYEVDAALCLAPMGSLRTPGGAAPEAVHVLCSIGHDEAIPALCRTQIFDMDLDAGSETGCL